MDRVIAIFLGTGARAVGLEPSEQRRVLLDEGEEVWRGQIIEYFASQFKHGEFDSILIIVGNHRRVLSTVVQTEVGFLKNNFSE